MIRASIMLMIVGSVLALSGCGPVQPLEVRQTAAAQTATILGCWPAHLAPPPPVLSPTATATIIGLAPIDQPTSTLTTPRPTHAVVPSPPADTLWWPPCTPTPLRTPVPVYREPALVPVNPERESAPSSLRPALDERPVEISIGNQIGQLERRGYDAVIWSETPRRAAVAWITARWRPDGAPDGDVWVSIVTEHLATNPERVNAAPVHPTMAGRVAIDYHPDQGVEVWYGTGEPDQPSKIWRVIGTIHSLSAIRWSEPEVVADGSVQALRTDERGVTHAVRIAPTSVRGTVWYGQRLSPREAWTWEPVPFPGQAYHAAMTVTRMAGVPVVAIVITPDDSDPTRLPVVGLAIRHGDQPWRVSSIVAPHLVGRGGEPPTITMVPEGDGIILAAWTSYGGRHVAAAWSFDGGATFQSAVVALYTDASEIFPEDPSVGIDRLNRQLIVVWNERGMGVLRDPHREGRLWPEPVRSRMAWTSFADPSRWNGMVDLVRSPEGSLTGIIDPQRTAWHVTSPRMILAGAIRVDPRNQQWRLAWVWWPISTWTRIIAS